MSIDKETARKVSSLARIKTPEDQLDKVASELDKIISFVEQLAEVNTDNVARLPSPVDINQPLREDAITDGGYADKVLANAPETQEGYFVVPKIIE